MSSLTDFFQYYKFCSLIAAILKFEPKVTIQKYLVVKSKISKNRILWWRSSRPPPRAKAKIDQLISKPVLCYSTITVSSWSDKKFVEYPSSKSTLLK